MEKVYDLEVRTATWAKKVRDYVKKLPREISNIEYGKQLIRSSGSVAANYIEANESLGDKDFQMKLKICRKEAKESRLWLDLAEPLELNQTEKQQLMNEATEYVKIFSSMIYKFKK